MSIRSPTFTSTRLLKEALAPYSLWRTYKLAVIIDWLGPERGAIKETHASDAFVKAVLQFDSIP